MRDRQQTQYISESKLGFAKFGMHLHDHSGKGYFNFRHLEKFGFTMADSSIRGMGKGFGNLRTEFIIDEKY